jgi:fructose-specific phosphotransferase system IIC component
MQMAVDIIFGVFLLLPVVVALGLFVWAAKKDGEDDKAVQERLGTRRKT